MLAVTYEDITVRVFDAKMDELVYLQAGIDEQYPWRPHCVVIFNSGLVLFSDLKNRQLLLYRLVENTQPHSPYKLLLQYVNMLAEELQVRLAPNITQHT